MATANFNISPEDGWTEVLADASYAFIRVSVPDCATPWYVALAATAPSASTVGARMMDDPFCVDNNVSTGVYVRVVHNWQTGNGENGVPVQVLSATAPAA